MGESDRKYLANYDKEHKSNTLEVYDNMDKKSNTPYSDPYELSTIPEETLEVGDIVTFWWTDEWVVTDVDGPYKIKNMGDLIRKDIKTACIKVNKVGDDAMHEVLCEIGEEHEGPISGVSFIRKGVGVEKPTPKPKCNNCGAEALQPNGACQICTACGSQVGGC